METELDSSLEEGFEREWGNIKKKQQGGGVQERGGHTSSSNRDSLTRIARIDGEVTKQDTEKGENLLTY